MSDRTLHNTEEDVEIEIDDKVFIVQFERETKIVCDPDYGADADGRRGEYREWADDDAASDIYVMDEDAPTSKPLSEFPEDFQKKMMDAIDVWMENHEASE